MADIPTTALTTMMLNSSEPKYLTHPTGFFVGIVTSQGWEGLNHSTVRNGQIMYRPHSVPSLSVPLSCLAHI